MLHHHLLVTLLTFGIIQLAIVANTTDVGEAGCEVTQFQCANGQCIRQIYRCDTEADCTDESDEENCAGTVCDELEFRCHTSGQCIPKSYICDGENDCQDNSDESLAQCMSILDSMNSTTPTPSPTTPSSSVCDYTQFACRTRSGGNCITKSYICDNDRDCLDGSDEANCNLCVKPVVHGELPECKVTFLKGIYRDIDSWSCLNGPKTDAFRVAASRSHTPETGDPFADPKVSYMKIVCVAPYGIDFHFEGVGAVETFRIWKSQKTTLPGYNLTNIGYQINVDTVLTPASTGNYSFRDLLDPAKQVSLFVLVENDRKPFIIGNGRILSATKVKIGKDAVEKIVLPCISSKLNQNISLFKQDGTSWSRIDDAEYNPMYGFIFNASSSLTGKYHCTTDAAHKSDVDLVTVIVDTELVTNLGLASIEPNIKIVFDKKYGAGAACHTINDTTSSNNQVLTLTNLHASNPSEARLSVNCFTKGYKLCGSRPLISNHHIPTAVAADPSSACGKGIVGKKCTRISNLYSQGVLVCKLGEEIISQEYFIGLDKKVYRNFDEAPLDALMKIELPSRSILFNGTFETSTSYTFRCTSIGMEFARNPLILSAIYGNTSTVEKLSTSSYTDKSVSLKAGNVELSCSDHLWRTNEVRKVSVNVSVSVKPCTGLQWTCENGQCIRLSYRCDGGADCADRSDEKDCIRTTTPRSTRYGGYGSCMPNQFTCLDGTCKPLSFKCDGDRDCPDGSDEIGCWNRTTTTTTVPTTTTTTTTTTQRPKIPCTSKEFECISGKCIALVFKCDGEIDCDDQSDETLPECTVTSTTTPRVATHLESVTAVAEINVTSEKVQVADKGTVESEIDLKNGSPLEQEGHYSYLIITIICIGGLMILLLVVAVTFKYYKVGGIKYGRHIQFKQDQEEVLMD